MAKMPSAVRGGLMVFCDEIFSHWRIGFSPPSPGVGVVGVDVGMSSTWRGRQVKLTAALPGATSLWGRLWG